jgi:hypothetical protein
MLLVKPIKNKVIKRDMFLAKNIKLTGTEKESLSKILRHNNLLLKAGPLDTERMFDFAVIGTVICPKIFHNVATVTYPNFKMPLDFMKKSFHILPLKLQKHF